MPSSISLGWVIAESVQLSEWGQHWPEQGCYWRFLGSVVLVLKEPESPVVQCQNSVDGGSIVSSSQGCMSRGCQ